MIPLFDLHCDTLLELYRNKLTLDNCKLHISKDDFSNYSPYIQVLAIWSDNNLDNESCFLQYKKALSYARAIGLQFVDIASDFRKNSYILAVEDARLLNGDLSRLTTLSRDGVKFLTLNWQGQTIIGGGWDTSLPLTDFGKKVVYKCFDLGIVPDLSHSSYISAKQVMEMCINSEKSVVFSHSNAFSAHNHNRNITDDLFLNVIKTSSLVGLSLVSQHLSRGSCSIKDFLNHIYHFLSLGGENYIALGCDFDGTDDLPRQIHSIRDLSLLYYEIENEFGRDIAQKIFFSNAYKFYCKNFN